MLLGEFSWEFTSGMMLKSWGEKFGKLLDLVRDSG